MIIVENEQVKGLKGQPLEHWFGDSMWYITNDSKDSFKLIVVEYDNYVGTIKLNRDGAIEYLDDCDAPIYETDGEFWSREEAEEWLNQNMPKDLILTKETDVFYVDERTGRVQIGRVDGLVVHQGKVTYRMKSDFGSYDFFVNDDINKDIFLTYEELKANIAQKQSTLIPLKKNTTDN